MGITLQAMEVIKACRPFKTVLSLGYLDIVIPKSVLEVMFDVKLEKTTDHGAWHGAKFPLPETDEFFTKIGAKAKYIDIVQSRGIEEICDLNYPQELGKFDLVLDCGTLEHCFHIGQALQNVSKAVSVGGRIFHATPMSMLNHGFYNVCPTLYHDFYTRNGWEIERWFSVDREGNIYEPPPIKRFLCVPEAVLFCVAKRPLGATVNVPIQSKYALNPALH